MKFKFVWDNDEHCDIFLDEVFVGYMDHDSHGWDGMLGIRDVVIGIAGDLGADVEIEGEEGI